MSDQVRLGDPREIRRLHDEYDSAWHDAHEIIESMIRQVAETDGRSSDRLDRLRDDWRDCAERLLVRGVCLRNHYGEALPLPRELKQPL